MKMIFSLWRRSGNYWNNHHNPLGKTFILRYIFTICYIFIMFLLCRFLMFYIYSEGGKGVEEISLISYRFFLIFIYPTLIIALIRHEVSRYSPYYYGNKWRKFCDYSCALYWSDEVLGIVKTNLWWIFFLLWVSAFLPVFLPLLMLQYAIKNLRKEHLIFIGINKKFIKKSFFKIV